MGKKTPPATSIKTMLPSLLSIGLITVMAVEAETEQRIHEKPRTRRTEPSDKLWMGEWEDADVEPVFIHVPKNGGTAIKRISRMSKPFLKRSTGCTLWHMPPQWLPEYGAFPRVKGTIQKTNSFMVVRNPYSRAISQWKYVLSFGILLLIGRVFIA